MDRWFTHVHIVQGSWIKVSNFYCFPFISFQYSQKCQPFISKCNSNSFWEKGGAALPCAVHKAVESMGVCFLVPFWHSCFLNSSAVPTEQLNQSIHFELSAFSASPHIFCIFLESRFPGHVDTLFQKPSVSPKQVRPFHSFFCTICAARLQWS